MALVTSSLVHSKARSWMSVPGPSTPASVSNESTERRAMATEVTSSSRLNRRSSTGVTTARLPRVWTHHPGDVRPFRAAR